MSEPKTMFKAAILTISDRSFAGKRPDQSGPLAAEILIKNGYQVIAQKLVPDELEAIKTALCELSEQDEMRLILTTGGTGFAPRDVTPEATLAVCDRIVPGIPEAMRAASLKITPKAMLSRAQAGIKNQTLIINLPGSPKAVQENLDAILPALSHGLELLSGHFIDP